MLAEGADGCTDALLVGHGFAFDLMARLVREGLATATLERTFAAGKVVEVTRLRITDAGRWPDGGRRTGDEDDCRIDRGRTHGA
jgi:hypothetical protein